MKQLIKLIEKLMHKFSQVKGELEASRLDIDSVRCAVGEMVTTLLTDRD